MLNYELPDFTGSLGLNLFFVRLLHERPGIAMPGVAVESLYGSFPNCLLNGGRTFVRERASAADIERTFCILEEYGVVPRLTFTNMHATPEMLRDPYVDAIFSAAARHGGQVIAYADFVADYARERFSMPTVLSTTREITDADELNRQLERYDYVVLNYNLNKRRDVIAAVKAPERLEVMVNEFCMPGCPRRAEHYAFNSARQFEGELAEFPCIANKPDFFLHEPGHPTIFTSEEAQEYHDELGIRHFKIVGRGVPFETQLESLVYYLVAPDWREAVRAEVNALRAS